MHSNERGDIHSMRTQRHATNHGQATAPFPARPHCQSQTVAQPQACPEVALVLQLLPPPLQCSHARASFARFSQHFTNPSSWTDSCKLIRIIPERKEKVVHSGCDSAVDRHSVGPSDACIAQILYRCREGHNRHKTALNTKTKSVAASIL